MPDDNTQPTAFVGEVPPAMRCGFCKRPIGGVFYRAFQRFACADCAAEAMKVAARNQPDAASTIVAGIAGFAVAMLGALVWAAIVEITHLNIGIVAAGIGILVGKTIHATSGQRRGVHLQWLSAILSALGVAAGKIALRAMELWNYAKQQNHQLTPNQMYRGISHVLVHDPSFVFAPTDVIWIGIAAYAAWRLCKPVQIHVAGPYANQPATTTTGLQFNTVEPVSDASRPS